MIKTYKITYQENNKKKSLLINTENIKNETLPLNILNIKEVSIKKNINIFSKKKQISNKDLNLLFYELNIMVQSNIVFTEALDILIKNRKNEIIKEFLIDIKNSFTNLKPITKALEKYEVDEMVFSFLELCQSRGNIKLNIKALNILLHENARIKNDFKKAISYPITLLISFFLSLNMIFYFVIPNFKSIFSGNMESLPLSTKVLFFVHDIYSNYILFILFFLIILSILLYVYYKNNEKMQYYFDEFIVKKLYLFKDIYLSSQAYKLFLVLDIMHKSNYEFHKALISSKVLLKNKYLLDRITLIENLLENGKTINYSFSEALIFDDLVLNLINTAEVSNSLDITIVEIKEIYKNRFEEKIKFLISIIEPIFIVLLMGLILWIVLAIFVPIWDMGNMIKS